MMKRITINTFVVKPFDIPVRTTGKDLYDYFGIDFRREVIVLAKPCNGYNVKYIVLPDNDIIEFTSEPDLSSASRYLFFVLDRELFSDGFYPYVPLMH